MLCVQHSECYYIFLHVLFFNYRFFDSILWHGELYLYRCLYRAHSRTAHGKKLLFSFPQQRVLYTCVPPPRGHSTGLYWLGFKKNLHSQHTLPAGAEIFHARPGVSKNVLLLFAFCLMTCVHVARAKFSGKAKSPNTSQITREMNRCGCSLRAPLCLSEPRQIGARARYNVYNVSAASDDLAPAASSVSRRAPVYT